MTATKQRDRNRFQPGVMELERRMAPSSIRAGAFARPSDPYQLDRLAASASVAQPAPMTTPSTRTVRTLGLADPKPLATLDFSRLPGDREYTITIKMTARDGTPYEVRFATMGIAPMGMRNLVRESMKSGGWIVENHGDTRLLIRGHGEGAQFSPIKTINKSEEGIQAKEGLKITLTTGVELGQKTQGEPWTFSFSPTKAAQTIEQNALIRTIINGVTITADVTAGMTATDVAFSLYSAMVSAGMTGAQLLGSDIVFLFDVKGQETVQAELFFDSHFPGGPRTDWLEIGATIPQRSYV